VYCTNCGAQRPDYARSCPSCGTPVQTFAVPGQVPNYLTQSILVTLCCCLPLGIVAIVYSTQVNSKLAMGDVAGAVIASNNAKMWAWIAFGLGILSNAGLAAVSFLGQ
jgi:Interferon-induced transmembrane protein/zinc-ribbon domain